MASPATDQPSTSPGKLEVLILAPTGQDATLIATALAREEIRSSIFTEVGPLCDRLNGEAGCLLIAEEALSAAAIALLGEAIAQQEPWSDTPIIIMTGRGETSLTSLRVLKAFAPSGNVTLIERPFRPITLTSTLQVALRSRKRQYQVRELLQLQAQATRIRDEFISIASHELKTPLTSLKLQTQLNMRLQSKEPEAFPKRITHLIETTDAQVNRLTRLVEDMLDVSRITSGKLAIQKSKFDLTDLIRDSIERLMPQLLSVGCAVSTDCTQGIVGMWDRYRIEQVINNLMTNVIRYSAGKPVHVSVLREGDIARLKVQDYGVGIAPENLDRIFHRFERAVHSNNISGLGLGLYISREIVEAHRGSIRVESKLGQGATFVVELPIELAPVTAEIASNSL